MIPFPLCEASGPRVGGTEQLQRLGGDRKTESLRLFEGRELYSGYANFQPTLIHGVEVVTIFRHCHKRLPYVISGKRAAAAESEHSN